MRHLICVPYNVENLHLMAQALGIKRCWFHNGAAGRFPHYDIPKRRIEEIRSRCEVVSARELLQVMKDEKSRQGFGEGRMDGR
jgi:FMN phosphatase YigB (HAD superfamily)